MHYKWKTGMWAFVFHRASGLALSLYLLLHINVVSSLYNPAKFDNTMGFLGSPLFRILEIGLLAAVLYHSLNGIRIFLIDFTNSTRKHSQIFWLLAVVGLIIFVAGAYPMLHHAGIL
ncbi:MAG: succinate dehydrogenase, cytochrome b556 subunit [bacterium]|nr:succinate dehydrogenase, cytochrome b556 subunit [bacterium]